MGVIIEIPPALRGEAQQQIAQLHSYLFRLSEGLSVELDRMGGAEAKSSTSSGSGLGVKEYKELRDMIGSSSKEIVKLVNQLVPQEVATQLRAAEQSGDFDGNGIASTTFNEDNSITFGYTDGSYFQTPSLKGDKGEGFRFEVGDVFVTTRSGDPAELLGYGEWETVATSPALMWKRIE